MWLPQIALVLKFILLHIIVALHMLHLCAHTHTSTWPARIEFFYDLSTFLGVFCAFFRINSKLFRLLLNNNTLCDNKYFFLASFFSNFLIFLFFRCLLYLMMLPMLSELTFYIWTGKVIQQAPTHLSQQFNNFIFIKTKIITELQPKK